MTIISKTTLIERTNHNLSQEKLTKSQIELVINDFLEQIKNSLIKDEEIRIPNYFSLKTTITKPRTGMNLKTKQKMNIPAKKVPKVKFSEVLKTEIAKSKGKK